MTRIAVSMGDPTGIGPEVILKVIAAGQIPHNVHLSIHADMAVFSHFADLYGLTMHHPQVSWIELGCATSAGQTQINSLTSAATSIKAGTADALCTAPITKSSVMSAGFNFPGHTEFLADFFGAQDVVMMLAGPVLRVVPATIHVPLCQVAGRLSAPLLATKICTTTRALVLNFGIQRPRVALLGVNPHAGEHGHLGREEIDIYGPAVQLAQHTLQHEGICAEISEPLAADGYFAHGVRHDVVIGAYHDQVLVPFKMMHRDDGVNVTCGLSVIRTSPAHGSALDIAGRGIARPDSFAAAIALATELSKNR